MDSHERSASRALPRRETEPPRDLRPPSFADLLRRYRAAAVLTQEELAERATLSVQAISALERGLRRYPQRETVRLLAQALGLAAAELDRFLAASRRRDEPVPVPLAAPPPRLGNLPTPPAPLIGRAAAVAMAVAQLREPDTRLLTVTGPGGIGKSRLALAIAEPLRPDYPDGVFFVSLAALDDPALVAAAIAPPLGIAEQGARPLRETLLDTLRAKRLLLLLDNFEQLLPATALVEDLLTACPGVTILITSRAALRSRWEHEAPLAPLALPEVGSVDPAAIASAPAVALFVARAAAIRPDFQVTRANAPAVAAICRRLDGLPLAIELAAARLRLLSPGGLLGRLDAPFALLTGGSPGRHGTLRDTIAWSHDLLDADERRLFRRLAIFAGGCTIDAVEAVCAEVGAVRPILDDAEALVAQSLVQSSPAGDDEPRLVLLETLHEFGRERLVAAGEDALLRERHADYYLALAEGAGLRTGANVAALAPLGRDEENLRAALAWVLDRRDAARGLRLGAALWRYWLLRGQASEGRRWLTSLFALPGGDEGVRGHVAYGLSVLATVPGDYGESQRFGTRALAIARETADSWLIASALNQLGILARYRHDDAAASAHWTASVARFRALGDRRGEALVINNLGLVALNLGDYAGARAAYAASLALKRAAGDERGMALSLVNLGETLRREGDLAGARARLEESVAHWRAVGDRLGLASANGTLGQTLLAAGDLAAAVPLLEESAAAYRDGGDRAEYAELLGALVEATLRQGAVDRAGQLAVELLALASTGEGWRTTTALDCLAAVALARGQGEYAATLLGASNTLRDRLGDARPLIDRDAHARYLVALAQALGAERAAVALAAAQRRDPGDVVAETLTFAAIPGDAPA